MGNSFRGWYFKCQSPTQTLALIPAIHTCRGRRTSSIQIVTEHEHWNIPLPGEGYLVRWDRPQAKLGQNYFSPQGVELHLHSQHCHVEGKLRFGQPASLPGDIGVYRGGPRPLFSSPLPLDPVSISGRFPNTLSRRYPSGPDFLPRCDRRAVYF